MKKTFGSKISYSLLIFVILVVWGPVVPILWKEIRYSKIILNLLFLTLIFLLILYFIFGTRYMIEGDKLKIKSGFISFSDIPIESIKEIRKTNSIWSAPAPSFDRILIKYGKNDEIIVSPKDRQEFIRILKKINPSIKTDESL